MTNQWITSTLIAVFSAYVLGSFIFDQELDLFTQFALGSTLLVTIILAINLIVYYKDINIRFTKMYIFLLFSMISLFIAELLWSYYDFNGLGAYPSPAEFFYSGYFICSIIFCVIVFLKRPCFVPSWIKITGPTVAVLFFLIFLSQSEYTETFYIDAIMMAQSSVLAGVGTIAALFIITHRDLNKIWLMFGISFIANSITDLSYYSNPASFTYDSWMNIVWYGSILLIFYGMYSHRFLYSK